MENFFIKKLLTYLLTFQRGKPVENKLLSLNLILYVWKTKNIPQFIKKFSKLKLCLSSQVSTVFNISTAPTATT